MKTTASTAIALCLAIGAAHAQDDATPPGDVAVSPDWTFAVSEHGMRTAQAKGVANFGSKRWPATLMLRCTPGRDGSLAWLMTIDGARDGDGFDFAAFEGPDAPARDRQLTQLALEGGMLTTRFATAQNGYWTNNGQFTFEVSAGAWDTGNGALLADAVGTQTQAVLWTLRSPKEASQVIVARFAADGAPPVLRDAMQGCGPVPALKPDQLTAWRADATTMWQDRALLWRLKGVLGARYDEFAARAWPRGGLQQEGDVYYAIAEADADGNGAAVMFDAQGQLEALMIDRGIVSHHAWQRGAVRPPQALRDYLATNAKGEAPADG